MSETPQYPLLTKDDLDRLIQVVNQFYKRGLEIGLSEHHIDQVQLWNLSIKLRQMRERETNESR